MKRQDKNPFHKISRRDFLSGMVGLVGAGLLGGCTGRTSDVVANTTAPLSVSSVSTTAVTKPLLIVTEPWEPYIFDVGAPLKGMDYEITEAVFREMDIPITIMFYPFKRCLEIVKNQQADAILDLMVSSERKEFLFFADEYISASPTTLFFRKGEVPEFETLADLKDYVMGVQLGYEYPEEVVNAPLRKDEAPSLESNLQKLILGRIDMLVDNRTVVLYQAQQMGILDQIAYDPRMLGNTEETENHLGFAKKEGYEALATQFSETLKEFKTGDEYQAILVKYGQ